MKFTLLLRFLHRRLPCASLFGCVWRCISSCCRCCCCSAFSYLTHRIAVLIFAGDILDVVVFVVVIVIIHVLLVLHQSAYLSSTCPHTQTHIFMPSHTDTQRWIGLLLSHSRSFCCWFGEADEKDEVEEKKKKKRNINTNCFPRHVIVYIYISFSSLVFDMEKEKKKIGRRTSMCVLKEMCVSVYARAISHCICSEHAWLCLLGKFRLVEESFCIHHSQWPLSLCSILLLFFVQYKYSNRPPLCGPIEGPIMNLAITQISHTTWSPRNKLYICVSSPLFPIASIRMRWPFFHLSMAFITAVSLCPKSAKIPFGLTNFLSIAGRKTIWMLWPTVKWHAHTKGNRRPKRLQYISLICCRFCVSLVVFNIGMYTLMCLYSASPVPATHSQSMRDSFIRIWPESVRRNRHCFFFLSFFWSYHYFSWPGNFELFLLV